MSRSKYINTFNTTADYENYIDSALPEFPNVGYDKQAGEVKIVRTSPNDHYIYGELIDLSITAPSIYSVRSSPSSISTTSVQTSVDAVSNTFYYDSLIDIYVPQGYDMYPNGLFGQDNTIKSNIKNIKKLNFTNNITGSTNYMFNNLTNVEFIDFSSLVNLAPTGGQVSYMFGNCSKLKIIDMTGWDFSNVTNTNYAFQNCSSLTDVYITVEGTLMKFTNNLTSQGMHYIPSSATIHYNDVDYKWQNNRWTLQS